MNKYAGDGNEGQPLRSALALLLVGAMSCSDDGEDASSAGSGGTAGAVATAPGASGSAGAGGAPSSSAAGAGGAATVAGGSGGSSSTAGRGGTSGLSGSGGGAAGSSMVASVDAGTGLGNGETGDRQRCETAASCLEFRGHSQTCQVSNEANCANISNGTYLVGPCPTDEFNFAGVEETFCGPTATFLRADP